MSNNEPSNPPPKLETPSGDPAPVANNQPAADPLGPVPLRRIPRIEKRGKVFHAPAPPTNGGKRRTRRKHKKMRKTQKYLRR